MSLATQCLAFLERNHPGEADADGVATGIRTAFRFAVDREIVDFCDKLQVVDAPPVLNDVQWFEWEGAGPRVGADRHGVLMVKDEELTCNYWSMKAAPADKVELYVISFRIRGNTIDMGPRMAEALKYQVRLDSLRRSVLGILTFMASPKVVEQVERVEPRHVRRQAEREGRPLLSFSEVIIRGSRDGPRTTAGGVSGPGKVLHRCRGFPRTRRGRLELVRPHWRGDRRNGVKLSTYRLDS